jgi:oligosaccharide repeat unit polymerase
MYGSIAGVFLNANEIYRLRIEEKIPGIIPYINAFGYAGVFFAAVYSAYKGKITLISLLPLMAVVIKEVANVGRAGIMVALISYSITYFFTRNVVRSNEKIKKEKKKWGRQIAGFIIVLIILIAGASVVRSVRGTYESFAGATKVLSKTRGGLLITPSIYLYFSAHVGVLNQFLIDEEVDKGFGENTLLTVYSILSKFDLVERPSDYQEGYRIPMWTNTGTYLREIIEDFGYAGLFLFPFLLGILAAYFWYRLQDKKDMISLVLLTYTSIIIGYSYVVMVTRLGLFTISFTLLLTAAIIINKYERYQKSE